jgi:reverse gyrase
MKTCPNCGGNIIGDGVTTSLACENSDASLVPEEVIEGEITLCDYSEDYEDRVLPC